MYKIIYKFSLIIAFLGLGSIANAANTIQFKGNIIEETCSISQKTKDCEGLSNIKDNIKVNTHNLSSLINESQKNETVEINLVKEKDQNKAVLMVSYY
ncbi:MULTISPECIES: type 1 fimbrial protein [Acinetobacter]|jgi:type 1 fimbria pilin|uniref:type 1 fimbrial protein n=1 Tax=Acinetobacter TaxID=469 RepID=UPI00100F4BB8|nr:MULTISPECIES: type 1 fimbrial protein [Acinetobacter]MBY3626937.1 type 1 fimbrial protein [Acinetobacter sp. CUI P1]MBF4455665.1 type 1 fimbrial protein [Acinetobacter sp. SK-43]MDR7656421.1 type 1 fimbrial protein [Acinetobacter junii]RXS93939.1 type 1 fimbrial protein [Acinetobacter junii]RZG66469.1 type 1 fimbrial protein [Acinetobacter junii]